MTPFSEFAAQEHEYILTKNGFEGVRPELREAIARLCVAYLHRGATWALKSVVEQETDPDAAIFIVGVDLLSNVPEGPKND